MYQVIILPLAKDDIQQAASWYNSKQKGLGKKFTQAVRNKVSIIRQNPKIASIRYDDIRTKVLDIFPFMIHYSTDEQTKTVIISGVFHTSLSPKKWKQREN